MKFLIPSNEMLTVRSSLEDLIWEKLQISIVVQLRGSLTTFQKQVDTNPIRLRLLSRRSPELLTATSVKTSGLINKSIRLQLLKLATTK